jgi:hypothetical protein
VPGCGIGASSCALVFIFCVLVLPVASKLCVSSFVFAVVGVINLTRGLGLLFKKKDSTSAEPDISFLLSHENDHLLSS